MEPDCNIVCNIRIKFGCQVAFKNRMIHFSSSFTYSSKNFSLFLRLVSSRLSQNRSSSFSLSKGKNKKRKECQVKLWTHFLFLHISFYSLRNFNIYFLFSNLSSYLIIYGLLSIWFDFIYFFVNLFLIYWAFRNQL